MPGSKFPASIVLFPLKERFLNSFEVGWKKVAPFTKIPAYTNGRMPFQPYV
jgi:hypothetical protein